MKNEMRNICVDNDPCYTPLKLQSPFEHHSASRRIIGHQHSNCETKSGSSNASDTISSSLKAPNISNVEKHQVSDLPHSNFIADMHQLSKKSPKPPPLTPQTQVELTHAHRAGRSRASISARTKDFRLKGSDIYIARLGHDFPLSASSALPDSCQTSRPLMSTVEKPSPSPKSLHDELRCSTSPPPPPTGMKNPTSSFTSKPQVRASRPCYRCVTHMHAAGIARAFWTNAQGQWEGAKVRDLMDALEGGASGEDGREVDAGVFVTKHEVLMLRRMWTADK
jgi:hypothetical protein